MTDTLLIIAAWAAFTFTHILLCADAVRPRLGGRLGALPFQGIYSAISFATFVPIFVLYLGDGRHVGPEFYMPPSILRVGTILLMGLASLLLGAGVVSPAPSSFPGRGKPEAHGVWRITRHPVSAAFFLIGLAHLLVNGHASDLAFFGGFCVFTAAATRHQDLRKTKSVEGYALFRWQTSFLPFVAILRRKQSLGLALREWPARAAVVGAVIFVALYVLHGALFGIAL